MSLYTVILYPHGSSVQVWAASHAATAHLGAQAMNCSEFSDNLATRYHYTSGKRYGSGVVVGSYRRAA